MMAVSWDCPQYSLDAWTEGSRSIPRQGKVVHGQKGLVLGLSTVPGTLRQRGVSNGQCSAHCVSQDSLANFGVSADYGSHSVCVSVTALPRCKSKVRCYKSFLMAFHFGFC